MKADRAQQVHQTAELLFDADSVEQGIAALAGRVEADSGQDFPLVLCVMNGGLYLTGQLLRHWDFPLTLDYVHATRYRLATLGKDVLWKAYPQNEIKDRNVIIVDDIFDQGYTLEEVKSYCLKHGARKCTSVFLIRKTHDRKKADNSTYQHQQSKIVLCHVTNIGNWSRRVDSATVRRRRAPTCC